MKNDSENQAGKFHRISGQMVMLLLGALVELIISLLSNRAVVLVTIFGTFVVVATAMSYYTNNIRLKRNYNTRRHRSYEFYKTCKKKGESHTQYSDEYIEQNEEYYKKAKKLKKRYVVYVAVEIVVCALFVVLGALRTSQHQDVVETVPDTTSGRDALAESTLNNDKTTEETTDMEVPVEYGHIGFILMEPDRLLELSYSQRTQIFYLSFTEDEDKVGAVENHLQELLDEKRVNRSNEWTKVEATVIKGASENESHFENKKSEARKYVSNGDYEGWSYTIPNSDMLDEIIEDRKNFRSENVQEDRGNSKVAFLVANDYQEYALEYENQEGRIKTVIFYYGVSIIWTEIALTYEDVTQVDIEMYCDYILARYKDMSDFIIKNKDQIPEEELEYFDEIQSCAKEMYDAMIEYMSKK